MRILLVNNLFSRTNGADVMTYELYRMLNAGGHQAFVFAASRKPYFEPDYPYQHLFPEALELGEMSLTQKVRGFFKPVYNHDACVKLKAMLREVRPDLVHFQGIQRYLSPSVIQACKEAGIPMMMTVHDPFIVCPAATLMRAEQEYCGELLCTSQGPMSCIHHRCMRKSLVKSTYNAIEFQIRQWHGLYGQIHHFLTPSEAFRNLLIEAGFKPEKVTAVYNCIEDKYFQAIPPSGPGTYLLYVGRLVREKGLESLLKAMAQCPDVTLRVVGDGPLKPMLQEMVTELALENVYLLGFRSDEDLMNEYRNSLATVLPCNWFETFGLTVAESLAMGKPVIASRIGALPELIQEGETGLLFPAGDVDALAAAIRRMAADPKAAHHMGLSGRRFVKERFTTQHYYDNMIASYQQLLAGTRTKASPAVSL